MQATGATPGLYWAKHCSLSIALLLSATFQSARAEYIFGGEDDLPAPAQSKADKSDAPRAKKKNKGQPAAPARAPLTPAAGQAIRKTWSDDAQPAGEDSLQPAEEPGTYKKYSGFSGTGGGLQKPGGFMDTTPNVIPETQESKAEAQENEPKAEPTEPTETNRGSGAVSASPIPTDGWGSRQGTMEELRKLAPAKGGGASKMLGALKRKPKDQKETPKEKSDKPRGKNLYNARAAENNSVINNESGAGKDEQAKPVRSTKTFGAGMSLLNRAKSSPNYRGKQDGGKVKNDPKDPGFARLLDYSGQFTYDIPDGWSCTSNPFLPHDVLTRQSGEANKTITFKLYKARLEDAATGKLLQDEMRRRLKDFKLQESATTRLAAEPPVDVLRVSGTGSVDTMEVRQVMLARSYKGGQILVVCGTIPVADNEPLDNACAQVAASIDILKHPMKKAEKK